jgi:hypothetical protein
LDQHLVISQRRLPPLQLITNTTKKLTKPDDKKEIVQCTAKTW